MQQRIYLSSEIKSVSLLIIGKDKKGEAFVAYNPFPEFFEIPGDKKNTIEFSADLKEGKENFKCGIIFPVSLKNNSIYRYPPIKI